MTDEKTLLTARQTAQMLGVSVATVWRRVNDGTFPEPIRLGGATRWVRDELADVISTAQSKRNSTGR